MTNYLSKCVALLILLVLFVQNVQSYGDFSITVLAVIFSLIGGTYLIERWAE